MKTMKQPTTNPSSLESPMAECHHSFFTITHEVHIVTGVGTYRRVQLVEDPVQVQVVRNNDRVVALEMKFFGGEHRVMITSTTNNGDPLGSWAVLHQQAGDHPVFFISCNWGQMAEDVGNLIPSLYDFIYGVGITRSELGM
jgi:hypothetical protein